MVERTSKVTLSDHLFEQIAIPIKWANRNSSITPLSIQNSKGNINQSIEPTQW